MFVASGAIPRNGLGFFRPTRSKNVVLKQESKATTSRKPLCKTAASSCKSPRAFENGTPATPPPHSPGSAARIGAASNRSQDPETPLLSRQRALVAGPLDEAA